MNRGMLGFPAPALGRACQLLALNTVTPGSTNTKTAWVELCVTAQSYDGLLVNMSVAVNEALVDISVGSAGGETMIAENLHTSAHTATGPGHDTRAYHVPGVGAGVRLWARVQTTTLTSNGVVIRLYGLRGSYAGLLGLRCMETLGANVADSGGVSIDPGGSANTLGSWISLGVTTKHYRLLQVSIGQQNNVARSNATFLLSVGIGNNPIPSLPPAPSPDGSVVVARMRLRAHTSGDFVTPSYFGPFPVDIPPGTPLRAAAECTITDATDRLFDLIAYGLAA